MFQRWWEDKPGTYKITFCCGNCRTRGTIQIPLGTLASAALEKPCPHCKCSDTMWQVKDI